MTQLANTKINLNFMRAASCIAVMMVHLGQRITLPQKLQPIFDAGSSGVIVFFILSGYLGFLSYDKVKCANKSAGKWLLKHIGRILPVYYVMIAAYLLYYGVILRAVPEDSTGLGWFRYLFCVNQIVPATDGFWNNLGGTWTISAFLVFYLLVPLLHKVIRNYKQALFFFASTYVLGRALEASTPWFRVLIFIYYFAVGMILYYAMKEKKELNWTVQGLGLLLLLIITNAQGGLKIGLLVSVIMIQSMNYVCSNKLVETGVNIFSRYAYSIYLVHLFVIAVMEHMAIPNDLWFIAIFFIGTTLLSLVMYHAVEKPASSYLNKWLT